MAGLGGLNMGQTVTNQPLFFLPFFPQTLSIYALPLTPSRLSYSLSHAKPFQDYLKGKQNKCL